MKVYNSRIQNDLGLTKVTAGLAGAPTPETMRGGITQEQYMDDDTAVIARAASSLITEIDKAYDQRFHREFDVKEILHALSSTNRAVFFTGRFGTEILEKSVGKVEYGFVEQTLDILLKHGTPLDLDYPRPMLWIVTDKVINIPDVEKYTTKDDVRGKLLIPLNFEITDPSKIRVFSGNLG